MVQPTSSLASYPGYAIPQSELRRREHIGRNLLGRLVETGELDSFILGDRLRYIPLASWNDYLSRQLAGGIPRDPAVKAAAAEAYRLSLLRSRGSAATAKARANWGADHGSKGGSPHLAKRGASAAQKASPPASQPEGREKPGSKSAVVSGGGTTRT
jgi:hypothetical protein